MQDPDRQEEKASAAERPTEEAPRPGFWTVVQSTLAAAIGVQSSRNRERDFQHGNIAAFVTAGIIFTALFIAAVVTVVKLVLAAAGV